MKKQTAVEWLYEKILLTPLDIREINKCLEQAKAMEKEQMIKAIKLTIEKEYYEQTWAHCGSRNHMAEQYYNETYESNT